MNDKIINSIIAKFGVQLPLVSWRPYGHGHINDTYLLETPEGIPDFILQRKNHLVFKDISGMMNNILLVTNHIRKKLLVSGEKEPDRRVMTYLPDPSNNYFVMDTDGNYWTLFLFVARSHGIEAVSRPDQAFTAGKAFGQFQMQLSDLPGDLLIETIPGFHNGKLRFGQFKTAIENNAAGRVEQARPLIDRLLAYADEMIKLQDWLDTGAIPLRITHNDTKINNVLFDDNGNILCVIDLDTVMPGTALFDFGDAIRTLGNTAVEDEPDTSKISFHREFYQAFAQGYLSESSVFLTPLERENLAFSCRYMAWEQAIRFLSDYLNGDTYYKIAYPEHNHVRAKSQAQYLSVMDREYDFMKQATK